MKIICYCYSLVTYNDCTQLSSHNSNYHTSHISSPQDQEQIDAQMIQKALNRYTFYIYHAIRNLKRNIYYKPIHLKKTVFYFSHKNDHVNDHDPFHVHVNDHDLFIGHVIFIFHEIFRVLRIISSWM